MGAGLLSVAFQMKTRIWPIAQPNKAGRRPVLVDVLPSRC